MIEHRFLSRERHGLKLLKRAEGSDGLPKIGGTAAVYFDESKPDETQYQLWSDTFERLMTGCFDEAVGRDDVRALQNHDPTLLLGRTASGTLKLIVSTRGLEYEIDTADTTAGRDTVHSLERGDMSGSSFSFVPTKVTWTEEKLEDGSWRYYRNIEAVELYDVGPVTFPAYSGTDSGLRSNRSAGITAVESRSAEAEIEAIKAERQTLLFDPRDAAQKLDADQRSRAFRFSMLS